MKKLRREQPAWRLPLSELLPTGEVVVLYGNRRMTVQGCRRILSYSPARICLQLRHSVLEIVGEKLGCTAFSGGCTTIRGDIQALSYQTETDREVKK